MNRQDEVLHSRSAPLVGALSKLSGVKGILCFGSYAMGTFDQYSDVAFYTFCHPTIAPSSLRQETLEGIEGISHLQMDHAEFGWDKQWCPRGDRFRLNGVQYDITYNAVDWIRTVVGKVKEQGATTIPELEFRPYTMLGLLENSVVLHDPGSVLRDLRSSLYPYPPKLRHALLSQNLPILRGSIDDLKDCLRRDIGNTAFHFHFERILDSLGTILFAINERYDPATKRAEEAYRELETVPEDFLRRYNSVLETPLAASGRERIVRELQAIVDEIEILVEGKSGPNGRADPP